MFVELGLKWRRAITFSAFVVVISLSPIGTVKADDSLVPSESCGRLTGMIAAKKVDELPAQITADSRGMVTTEQMAGLLALKGLLEANPVALDAHLDEKNYSDNMMRVWRILAYEKSLVLYGRCTYLKVNGAWTLTDLKMDTDPEKVALP